MAHVKPSWSYSHFMYLLCEPFQSELENVSTLLSKNLNEIEKLVKKIYERCVQLENEMQTNRITFRQNKIFIHYFDVDYVYPEDYNFIRVCKEFIKSRGILVFDHLDNFQIIKKYLELENQTLSKVQHPMTADTIWHLNPFIIDMSQAEIRFIYNFRGETPNERRNLAELMDFPSISKFPVDVTNEWDEKTMTYVDKKCDKIIREPQALCKFIKKNINKV